MGILLVYDVTNYKSFDNIGKWLRNISEHANDDVEKMILGNKCDCDDRRIISREKGEAVAAEHNIRFLETSAKANVNIDRAFLDLAEAILNKQSAGRDQNDGAHAGDRVFVSRGSESRSSVSKCCSG
jgi:Ras-related protein Rab-10